MDLQKSLSIKLHMLTFRQTFQNSHDNLQNHIYKVHLSFIPNNYESWDTQKDYLGQKSE